MSGTDAGASESMSSHELKKLRDPVHQDIVLSDEEVRILDTAEVQRLRGIRQLGTAYLVYPGAQHTRFEHGTGTCWMARRIMERLDQSCPGLLSVDEKRAVLIAALIHDVTHVPFGHTIEDERRLFARHDEDADRFEHFYRRGQLGEALAACEVGGLVLSILEPASGVRPCLRQIVSGTICADLLDYVKRDNYFCGLSYRFDDRLFHYFRIEEDQLVMTLQQHGLFRHDALSEITHLLRIRYVLTERVYYHHTKIATGAMVSKALEAAVRLGFRQETLYDLTDQTLLYVLGERYGHDAGVRFLLDSLAGRRIYKRCYTLAREIEPTEQARLVWQFHQNAGGARETAEREIAERLGIADHEVIIYCPPAKMALKEAEVPVVGPAGRIQRLTEFNEQEIEVLKDKHRALWRFYVFIAPQHAARLSEAGEAVEAVVGLPNQLPTEKRGRI